MTPFLCIDPNSNVIATLGRFAHYTVMGHGVVRITCRPNSTIRPQRLMIAGPNADDWLIHDIVFADRSQFAQHDGPMPGGLFATTAIDAYISFDTVQAAMDVVVTVSNIGSSPRRFMAVIIGVDGNGQRCALPINSGGAEIAPGDDPRADEGESFGPHVIVELDDVLYNVRIATDYLVLMTKMSECDLSARALEEIDTNLDLRAPSVVSIRTLMPVSGHLPGVNRASLDADRAGFGMVMFDEAIGMPILTIGDVYHDGNFVECHFSGYQPQWLAAPVEDS